jgi:hypothetical protein
MTTVLQDHGRPPPPRDPALAAPGWPAPARAPHLRAWPRRWASARRWAWPGSSCPRPSRSAPHRRHLGGGGRKSLARSFIRSFSPRRPGPSAPRAVRGGRGWGRGRGDARRQRRAGHHRPGRGIQGRSPLTSRSSLGSLPDAAAPEVQRDRRALGRPISGRPGSKIVGVGKEKRAERAGQRIACSATSWLETGKTGQRLTHPPSARQALFLQKKDVVV